MKRDEILIKKSDSANPKLLIVIGNKSNAEAKIAGITPAVLILKVNVKTPLHKFYFPFVV